jgi:curli biogenesis system outer membrane secretion channel CsgG
MISKVLLATTCCLTLLGGCVASSGKNITLETGASVQSISTPYNDLISCVKIQKALPGAWAVGEISDATGKYSSSTVGAAGRFISQGAGDMMQTILHKAGAQRILNRRDSKPVVMETRWGARKLDKVMVSDFYVTGSINTLDFLPGASADLSIAGIGPRYRQHRVVVGLDLHLTDAVTTEVIAAVNVSKQIFTEEAGIGIGKFFGTTFVNFDLSAGNREPLQLSLRSMLQFGLYEMLTQLNTKVQENCQSIVNKVEGVKEPSKSIKPI